MAQDDVTLAVLGQRMDQLLAQFTQLNASLDADRRHNSETFARKDVLASTFEAVGRRITEAEKDIEDGKRALAQQQDKNRSMVIALIGIAIPALISVVGIILSVLGSGGVA